MVYPGADEVGAEVEHDALLYIWDLWGLIGGLIHGKLFVMVNWVTHWGEVHPMFEAQLGLIGFIPTVTSEHVVFISFQGCQCTCCLLGGELHRLNLICIPCIFMDSSGCSALAVAPSAGSLVAFGVGMQHNHHPCRRVSNWNPWPSKSVLYV